MFPAKVKSLSLQTRDITCLRGLFESRVMTAAHVAALYFAGKAEYTKTRLRQLKNAGLVAERQRRVNEPAILFLTRKGFSLLKSSGHLDGLPAMGVNSFAGRANVSELTLRHELEIMDVKAAVTGAVAKANGFSLQTFTTWPLLCQFEVSLPGLARRVLVRPDGFLQIHEAEEGTKGDLHDCFLEVDRSSESQDVLVGKAVAYLEYYRCGDFAVRMGGTREKLEEFPVRVLMVMKSAERRNNTAERLAHHTPRITDFVWLTTLAEVTTNPLGPIWIRPRDYLEATEGTPYYNENPKPGPVYRRQAERDVHIEAHIKKRHLLEG